MWIEVKVALLIEALTCRLITESETKSLSCIISEICSLLFSESIIADKSPK